MSAGLSESGSQSGSLGVMDKNREKNLNYIRGIQERKAAAKEQEKRNEALAEQIRSLTAALEAVTRERDDLKKRLESVPENVERKDGMEEQNHHLQAQIRSLSANRLQQQTELRSLREAFKAMKQQFIVQHQSLYKELEGQVLLLSDHLKRVQSERQLFETQCTDLQKGMEAIQKAAFDARQIILKQEAEQAALRARLVVLQEELRAAREEVVRREKAYKGLEQLKAEEGRKLALLFQHQLFLQRTGAEQLVLEKLKRASAPSVPPVK